MNKRLLRIALLCGALLLPLTARAEGALDGGADGKTYGTTFTGTSLSGGITSAQQYFRIEDYWKVGAVEVRLDYKASPLTQSERSSVTLLLNGTPFHSFRPVTGETGNQQLSVAVPASLLTEGVNTLGIQGQLETIDPSLQLVCLPTDTRGSWLQVLDSSRITVHYDREAMKDSIRDFNRHFIGLDTVDEGQNAVAVSGKSETAELEAAAYALSGFAKANSLKERTISLIPYVAEQVKGKRAVVLIALYDNLPDELKGLLSTGELQDKALLQLVKTADQPTLVITSRDASMLIKAGRLAANQALLAQIDANAKVVDATTEVGTPAASVSRNVVLTESGDQLTGEGHQERTYFVALPGNRSLADASKLSLDLRYARNLDMERSMVTVLIDKTPIGSKKLSSELADGDRLTLQVPKNLNISGNFSVTVAFDLELKHHMDCIERQDQMPWAFIGKDSLLQLNTKDRADLLLNNYPYPFLRDGSYNQVAVVLPSKRDAYSFQTLTHLFNLLGQYAQTNTGEVRFFGDEASAEELKGRQIIAIGSYQDNKVIRDSNEQLYFRYDPDGGGFVSNEKMSIETEYGKRIGSLQLIDSPYGRGNGLLAITGSGSEYVYLASKLLATEGTLWKVYGDGVVTDKDGRTQAFRFKKLAEPESPSVLREVLERKDVVGFTIAAVLTLVLVLVSLILMIRKHKKSTKRGRGR
ncbi:cellulose biosynthesis cyclic di-GMP-binding regulatory protein BcsB [Paenibacillus puerhi]|uniref:cellulose biosynthesis cyclic di-GMP-binding regulatory protein BcsB n=1 Tax=Paenibacillus puerhi TaxID=2692622 RepID=UPI00135756AE|nr:cellulose biosynthesis cyclic di-GMP-binding regulatory protein BcsB [Paenibacillus puerhi]